jgi:glycine cleavage system H protein
MVFLIVALMFIALIAASYIREKRKVSVMATQPHEEAAVSPLFPEPKIFLHPSHSYAKVISSDLVEIGLDDFARKAFGDVNTVGMPGKGQTLKRGDVAWKVKVGERLVSQRMPVAGEILEVNDKKPGSASWRLRIKPQQLAQDIAGLVKDSEAAAWLKRAQEAFLLQFSSTLVPAMQDGGELVEGFGRFLSDEHWKVFCREFFATEECES